MPRNIHSVDGAFGQKIHYDEYGNYIGESWPGLIEGTYNHYNADGQFAGYSDPGLFADLVHHDASGHYQGETWSGIADGHKVHYDTDGYAGDSWDSLLGSDTELFDDPF